MKKLFSSTVFQIYIFVLSFLFINIYLIFNVDEDSLYSSFFMIYTSWFILILILKAISTSIDDKGDSNV